MKKITKLGLSALCGSLAVASAANAGEISVSGTAEMTYLTVHGNNTGHPIGMKSNLTFTGSGELDGGQKVSLGITHTDKASWSAANIALTTNNIGTFTFSNGTGADLGDYDDKAPTAWEESWDAGQGATTDKISGVASSTNINWKSPATTGKIMGGTTLILAYTPQNSGVTNNDKVASGGSNTGRGLDAVLDLRAGKKLSGFLGYSRTELKNENRNKDDHTKPDGDREEAVIGLNYKLGPFSAGYQHSAEDLKAQGNNQAAAEVDMYLNRSWGIAMNINGGLSVSYGEATSNKIWTPVLKP